MGRVGRGGLEETVRVGFRVGGVGERGEDGMVRF